MFENKNPGKAKSQRRVRNSTRVKDRTFTHMNGNQLVSVGYTLYKTGELKEVSFFPVDTYLKPILTPFMVQIRSETLMLTDGIPGELVQDAVSDWFSQMRLPYQKKMILLVWDAVRFHEAFKELVDTEFEYIVHNYKCLQQIAHFKNDLAIERGEPAPFPKDNLLSSSARAIGDEFMEDCKNDSGYRSLLTAKLYYKILTDKETLWT